MKVDVSIVGTRTRPVILSLMVLIGACTDETASPPMPQFPSPMTETTRAHSRVEFLDIAPAAILLPDILPHDVEVYVPVRTPDIPGSILIHFHGASYIPWSGVAAFSSPPVLAVVNLGTGSAVYEQPFLEPDVFPRLLAGIREAVYAKRAEVQTGSAWNPEIYLSGFSAGYGAVRAILRSHDADIAGVLLLDGLHTDYVPDGVTLANGGAMNEEKLDPFVQFARLAMGNKRTFIFTHSAIFPGTYASTTETGSYILDQLGLKTKAVLEWGPGGMQRLSRADTAGLSIQGFAGNTAPDHMDHLHNMGAFLESLLGRPHRSFESDAE